MKKNFESFEINQTDESEKHRTSSEEIAFFNAVASGNLDAVKKNCDTRRFVDSEGVGVLSRDPVLNLKYHFVISCAIISRLCMEHGLIEELSYRMSDYYIQQLDDLHSLTAIEKLHDTMVLDYTARMRITSPCDSVSAPIQSALNYIYVHITDNISVEEIADAVGVSPGYLSHLFKKEIGVSISEYVRQKKIDTATNLLKFSPYSMVEISNRLSFSSQSHFIQTFKKIVGLTPLKYREKYGRSEWNVREDQVWL